MRYLLIYAKTANKRAKPIKRYSMVGQVPDMTSLKSAK